MSGDALQLFKNVEGPTRENLGETLAVFPRKYVKPQSMATAKNNFQKLLFNPANQYLVDFLDELQKLTENAFKLAAHAFIDQFINVKTPQQLKKNKKSDPPAKWHVCRDSYIVTHIEKELELNGLEALDELKKTL